MSKISDQLIEAAQAPLSDNYRNHNVERVERAFCLVLGLFFEQQERIRELEAQLAG